MSYKILVINPGSTSTKIGVYEDETLLFEETLRHSTEEIAKYATIVDQKDFRKELIVDILAKNSFDIKSLNVVVGRGGLLKPIPGGTYPVSDALLADLKAGVQGQHASNLGGILAREIGDETGGRTFCYPIRERVRGRNVRKNQSAWNRTGRTWRINHCSRSECEYLRDTYCRTSGGSQYLLSCEPACGEGSVRKNILLQM